MRGMLVRPFWGRQTSSRRRRCCDNGFFGENVQGGSWRVNRRAPDRRRGRVGIDRVSAFLAAAAVVLVRLFFDNGKLALWVVMLMMLSVRVLKIRLRKCLFRRLRVDPQTSIWRRLQRRRCRCRATLIEDVVVVGLNVVVPNVDRRTLVEIESVKTSRHRSEKWKTFYFYRRILKPWNISGLVAVWPNVGVKSSKIFSKSCPRVSKSV